MSLVALGLACGWAFSHLNVIPVDSRLYWDTAGREAYYESHWVASNYVYPPVLAQAIGLLEPVGWGAFVIAWTTISSIGLWVAYRAWSLPIIVTSIVSVMVAGLDAPLSNPLLLSIIGNLQPWIAALIVLSFRWPAAWAPILLTKIGPGVGLLWYVFRREWRNLAIALGATAVVAVVSATLAPSAWIDFVQFALANASAQPPQPYVTVPLWARLSGAVVLIWWGAKTDRPWVVPIAAAVSAIALYQWSWLTVALAALPLASAGRPVSRAGPDRARNAHASAGAATHR